MRTTVDACLEAKNQAFHHDTKSGRNEGVYSKELQCRVVEIRYGFSQRIGIAILGKADCTDMCGCISFFQRIDPKVRQIQTFQGPNRDTTYTRTGNAKWDDGIIGEWEAA